MNEKFAKATVTIFLLQIFLIVPAWAADANDDYLGQLSSEINRPEYLEPIRKEMRSLQEKEIQGLTIPSVDNTIMLEHALQKYAPTALKQYRGLTFVQKNRVFDTVRENKNKLSSGLQEILKISDNK